MRLKTSHGTYVVTGQNGELLHLPEPADSDFESVWNGAPPPPPVPGLVEVAITEGPLAPSTLLVLTNGLVAFRRDQLYLCADPALSKLNFNRGHVGDWERFAIESMDESLSRYLDADIFSNSPSNFQPILIETLSGYQIITSIVDADVVAVTWPDLSNDPIARYTMTDGSWIVDVDSTPEPDQPFLVYWFYPFESRIHVWRLDRSGRRILGYDLSDADARSFLLGRRALGASFTARLYMLAQKCCEVGTLALLNFDLSAAAQAGSAEAIYAVLCNPRAFAEDTVRNVATRAYHLMRAANRARTEDAEAHLKRFTVKAFSTALKRLDPALGGLKQELLQSECDFCEVFSDLKNLPLAENAISTSLHCHTETSLSARLGGSVSVQTLGIILRPGAGTLEFHYVDYPGGVRFRILDCIRYAYYVLSTNRSFVWESLAARGEVDKVWLIRFEVGDLPTTAAPSAAFERLVGDTNVILIPDPYYFGFKAFQRGWFAGDIPPWEEKATRFLWRGSTTGAGELTLDTLGQAPRVRLCELGQAIGPVADFGITDVVQARSDADVEEIKLYLQDLNIWRERVPQHIMGGSKFLLEIDGNANSWGFFAKLLMGCCILKVDSPFEQWFYDRLQPWVHYVPVANDLSDLPDRVKWCLRNERACRKIADAGRRFAESLRFDTEMAAVAQKFLSLALMVD